jgi:cell wall-associated NlpC family hydrolase
MTRLIHPLTAAERVTVVAAARAHLHPPAIFRHRGRSRTRLDCLGLVIRSLAAVGAVVQDREAYGRDPVNDGLRAAVVEHLGDPFATSPVQLAQLAPGDLVLMKWHTEPNHIAVVTDYVLGGLAIIHAYAQVGCVVEHALADPWPRRITEAFRP